MALKIESFRKTVAVAGTAEPLIATKLNNVVAFAIRALDTNTGKIFVGSSTSANSTNGMYLEAGESNEKSSRTTRGGIHLHWNLNLIYIDAAVAGEGVIVEYEVNE